MVSPANESSADGERGRTVPASAGSPGGGSGGARISSLGAKVGLRYQERVQSMAM